MTATGNFGDGRHHRVDVVAVHAIDSTVEQFIENSIELSVPAEGEQSEAVSHRDRTSGPFAVVEVDHVDSELRTLGNVEFGASFKSGRSSGFDQMDVGGEFSP